MSRNISTTVARETVLGEEAPLSNVSTYIGRESVHVDGTYKSGNTTTTLGLRITNDAAKQLVKSLAAKLDMTVS